MLFRVIRVLLWVIRVLFSVTKMLLRVVKVIFRVIKYEKVQTIPPGERPQSFQEMYVNKLSEGI